MPLLLALTAIAAAQPMCSSLAPNPIDVASGMTAVASQDESQLLVLLHEGKILPRLATSSTSALAVACARGFEQLARELLYRGADINYRGTGMSALQMAGYKLRPEVTRLLLSLGASPDQLSGGKDGFTALMFAAAAPVQNDTVLQSKLAVMHALISGGALVDTKNPTGQTALTTCCIDSCKAELGPWLGLESFELLLRSGASTETTTTFNKKKNHTCLTITSACVRACITPTLGPGLGVGVGPWPWIRVRVTGLGVGLGLYGLGQGASLGASLGYKPPWG